MRFRVGVVLLLLLVYVGVACRTPLSPNVDRNQAPETWITAAPFDTITTVKGGFLPTGTGAPGTIPVRFHVYWAGSDQDGAVSGFYWAVVETLPVPPPNAFPPLVPPLPGPKPSDYHFTTRSDSIFIFNVAEETPDRQHAFFIYSVDDRGKPDATPARFIFNALDNFPPDPVLTRAFAIGQVFRLVRPGEIEVDTTTVFPPGSQPLRLTDPFRTSGSPRDTVPSGSALYFAWRGEVAIPGTVITGYRYKLDEPEPVAVGPEVTSKAYFSNAGADTVPPTAGTKVFTLRAVDQAGGATTPEVKRQFQYNFSPITWWSGPDLRTPGVWQPNWRNEKYLLLSKATDGIRGSLFNRDSVDKLPASRAEHRSFLEIWKDTVFARAEFDTVHMNSWVVFHAGGFDQDSPYGVRADSTYPDLPSPRGPVLTPAPKNGSPIGFRSLENTRLDPYASGDRTHNAQTPLYPLFDANDVFNLPRIAGYHAMFHSGRAYAVIKAEDGDGATDGRVLDAISLADLVDEEKHGGHGGGTPAERDLKNQTVMVFYVNRPPVFSTGDGRFFPKLYPPSAGQVDTLRARGWELNLLATDMDPFKAGDRFGGPSAGEAATLRYKITVRWTGDPGSYTDGIYYSYPNIRFEVPDYLPTGKVTLNVELCDCDECELKPGAGRCVTLDIPVFYERP
ncbi:MAG TPA: hypothetical protein VGK93_12515 [Candidatus Eisenbacteria bacterium]|jgi:hypothetical protein